MQPIHAKADLRALDQEFGGYLGNPTTNQLVLDAIAELRASRRVVEAARGALELWPPMFHEPSSLRNALNDLDALTRE